MKPDLTQLQSALLPAPARQGGLSDDWPEFPELTPAAVLFPIVDHPDGYTVLLTQRLARALQPHQGPRLSAALIALYGLTQLAAPWLTSIWMGMGGSLHSAFWLGAGALLWGLLWMLMVPRRR